MHRLQTCEILQRRVVECQKNHRPLHKKECKKRAAEIRDDRLFRQPDGSHLGECPICCLPLPLDLSKFTLNSCCCKFICNGCSHAHMKRELEQGLEERCVFCREPVPFTQEKMDQNEMKRVKANDPVALCKMGMKCRNEGNYEVAYNYNEC